MVPNKDNPLVVVEKSRKRKKRVVIVEYEKSYKSINWEFMYYMMRRLSFCSKWIGWIKTCMKSSIIPILVNGSPTQKINPFRGLIQGDHMTPFSFPYSHKRLSMVS